MENKGKINIYIPSSANFIIKLQVVVFVKFQAIEKTNDSCLLYTNRALTCLYLELYTRALSDCEWALKLNEKSLKALLYKAKAYHYLGESDKSAECIKAAEKYNPNSKSYIQGQNCFNTKINNFSFYLRDHMERKVPKYK